MHSFVCRNCGECCGPIPLLNWEFNLISLAVRALPVDERERLKRQRRKPLMCPLRDIERRRCAIYFSRPKVCEMYGHYEGLECPRNKDALLKTRGSAYEEQFDNARPGEYVVGVMGEDIGWHELEAGTWEKKRA